MAHTRDVVPISEHMVAVFAFVYDAVLVHPPLDTCCYCFSLVLLFALYCAMIVSSFGSLFQEEWTSRTSAHLIFIRPLAGELTNPSGFNIGIDTFMRNLKRPSER